MTRPVEAHLLAPLGPPPLSFCRPGPALMALSSTLAWPVAVHGARPDAPDAAARAGGTGP